MNITLNKSKINRATVAPPSKSIYHRALICAALSCGDVKISPYSDSEDILATIDCLRSIGTIIEAQNDGYLVKSCKFNKEASINCRECGTTLRFTLPLCAALGINTHINGSEGLSKRPISPLDEILSNNGVKITKDTQLSLPLHTEGILSGEIYEVPGNISSQYISGMMFALVAQNKHSVIKITEKIESAPYIDITFDILKQFGFNIDKINEREYHIDKKILPSPDTFVVEGDYSNAAFWLCAGAISAPGSEVICKGLNFTSKQGDKKILEILQMFGAEVSLNYNIYVNAKSLTGIEIDVSDIPDLVPVLSVVASVSKGLTTLKNISRLRIKESDRVVSTVNMINSLGGNASFDDANIYINGVEKLSGGTVDSYNDHRIAMSAAIASIITEGRVEIIGAEAVKKSYPTFFEELETYTKE